MFDGLDREHAAYLAAQSRPIVLPAGQVLFRRGTPSSGFYVVRNGRMQLSVSNAEGVVKVIEIISPGGAFGHAVMFLRDPYPVDATALVDTHLVFVPASAVDGILEEDQAMARLMLASMAKRLQAKIQDIAMLSLQSAAQRSPRGPDPCGAVLRGHLSFLPPPVLVPNSCSGRPVVPYRRPTETSPLVASPAR